MISDIHGAHATGGCRTECTVAVAKQMTRRFVPWERISHLTGDALGSTFDDVDDYRIKRRRWLRVLNSF
jgi:hypothetical protein